MPQKIFLLNCPLFRYIFEVISKAGFFNVLARYCVYGFVNHAVLINFNFAYCLPLCYRCFDGIVNYVKLNIRFTVYSRKYVRICFGIDGYAVFLSAGHCKFFFKINVFIEYQFIFIICKTEIKHFNG